MDSVLLERKTTRTLPPLILHPFADAAGPGKLMDSSRASLMLQGLLPTGDLTAEQLEQRLLDGRYYEIRMLFYVGRDLLRWIDQGQEHLRRHGGPETDRCTFQSFVSYLITKTPAAVQAKLRRWGVTDYKAIFSRAIALNSIFANVPPREALSDDFIRNYYRYADCVFKMLMQGFMQQVDDPGFEYELYASGEYSRLLERQWGESSSDATAS